MSNEKLKEVLFEIYRDLYRYSTPSADFDKLVEEAPRDEHGRKVIDYDSYLLDEDVYDEIVRKHLDNTKGLTQRDKQVLKTEAYLGCGPRSVYKKREGTEEGEGNGE